MEMTAERLQEILANHQKWLKGEADLSEDDLSEDDLSEADLREADLRGAKLSEADMRGADLREADLRGANLSEADLSDADLREAYLCYADLRYAYLCKADLCGADVDFSCWPLWCGSLDVKTDARIARQLAYHLCRLDCGDPEYIAARNALVPFANKFHRAKDYGLLEEIETKESESEA
jgi:hypothetical protein